MSNKLDHKPDPSWAFKTEQRQRWAYWDNLFTPEECDMIISDCNVYNLMRGQVIGNSNHESVRDSDITWITPQKNFEWMYNRLTGAVVSLNDRYFGFDLWGFGESLQFTKYEAPAGKYDSHVDCSLNASIRKLSIVLQLSDPKDYEGGDFEIIDQNDPEKLLRSRGTLLAFPSFTMHRVTPVTQGTRYSLVGWITGPSFK
jgi:PKHD-type hydroxylase